jgi:hypothetical protein
MKLNTETVTKQVTKEVELTSYEYAYEINIKNTFNGVPELAFKTATAYVDEEGNEWLGDYKRTIKTVVDPTETFDILDEQDIVVGQETMETLMGLVYMYSLHVIGNK